MMVAFINSMTKQGSGENHIRVNKSWTEEVWERLEQITGQTRPDWIPKTKTAASPSSKKPR
jgi:hypothetical protein